MEKMVTRTFRLNTAKVMTADSETGAISNLDFTFTETIAPEDVVKVLNKKLSKSEGNTTVVLKLLSLTTTDTLYGMTEADFIKYSKVLPPRTVQSD